MRVLKASLEDCDFTGLRFGLTNAPDAPATVFALSPALVPWGFPGRVITELNEVPMKHTSRLLWDARETSPDAPKVEARPSVGVLIRWMIKRDIPNAMMIDGASFRFPWAEEDWKASTGKAHQIQLVAEVDHTIAGFVAYELRYHSIEILRLAVSPEWRRLGIGRELVDRLIGKLHPGRRELLKVFVHERHLPSQLFFRDCGFRAERVVREFYEDTNDDAYLMTWRTDPSYGGIAGSIT